MWRIGFPVSADLPYVIELEFVRKNNEYDSHSFISIDGTKIKRQLPICTGLKWAELALPTSMLEIYCFYVKFPLKNCSNNNYPLGRSCGLASIISIPCGLDVARGDNSNPSPKDPLILFSAEVSDDCFPKLYNIEIKPTNNKFSETGIEKSLSDKWSAAIKSDAHAIFLHERDAKILEERKNVISLKLEDYSNIKEVPKIDGVPLLFSCKEDQIINICKFLCVSYDIFVYSDREKQLIKSLNFVTDKSESRLVKLRYLSGIAAFLFLLFCALIHNLRVEEDSYIQLWIKFDNLEAVNTRLKIRYDNLKQKYDNLKKQHQYYIEKSANDTK